MNGDGKAEIIGFGDAGVYVSFLSTIVPLSSDYCSTSSNQCVNPNTYCPSGKNCINTGTDYCVSLGNQCLNPNTYCPSGKNCINTGADYCATSGYQCLNLNTYCPSEKNCINAGADYCATSGNQCVNPNTYCSSGKNCINTGTDYCAASGNQCVNPSTYCPSGKNCINTGTDYCAASGNQCVNPNTYSPPGTVLCAATSSDTLTCGNQKYVTLDQAEKGKNDSSPVCESASVWNPVSIATTVVASVCAIAIPILLYKLRANAQVAAVLQAGANTVLQATFGPAQLNDAQQQAVRHQEVRVELSNYPLPIQNNYMYPPAEN